MSVKDYTVIGISTDQASNAVFCIPFISGDVWYARFIKPNSSNAYAYIAYSGPSSGKFYYTKN